MIILIKVSRMFISMVHIYFILMIRMFLNLLFILSMRVLINGTGIHLTFTEYLMIITASIIF